METQHGRRPHTATLWLVAELEQKSQAELWHRSTILSTWFKIKINSTSMQQACVDEPHCWRGCHTDSRKKKTTIPLNKTDVKRTQSRVGRMKPHEALEASSWSYRKCFRASKLKQWHLVVSRHNSSSYRFNNHGWSQMPTDRWPFPDTWVKQRGDKVFCSFMNKNYVCFI